MSSNFVKQINLNLTKHELNIIEKKRKEIQSIMDRERIYMPSSTSDQEIIRGILREYGEKYGDLS